MSLPRFHEDPDVFRAALSYTERVSGFSARLIEKDYYCSLVLMFLCGRAETPLVFRGGTSLSKVHAEFYRLSEDLDFVIPTPLGATRKQRRSSMKPLKKLMPAMRRTIPALAIPADFEGHNQSRHYVAAVQYRSRVTAKGESIKVEIGLREPLLQRAARLPVRTLIVDAFRSTPAVDEFTVAVMSRSEAYAEKCRAALTRSTPAVRDVFDLDHAVRTRRVDPIAQDFVTMVKKKLGVPGTGPVDVSPARRAAFERQVATELKPVLRPEDFGRFDFDDAFRLLQELGRRVAE